jgi:NACalpha-BTF3-like transcription factor
MEAQQQAQQLDSVTDVVADKELDESKALQAMSALTSTNDAAEEADQVTVSASDVALIVSELEISEEAAIMALRQVAPEVKEGESLVVAALRKLVTS